MRLAPGDCEARERPPFFPDQSAKAIVKRANLNLYSYLATARATWAVFIKVEESGVEAGTKAKKQGALSLLYAGISAIDDEPLDAEFDAIMNRRFNISRELSL